MRLLALSVVFATIGTACADPALEGRVTDLEAEVAALKTAHGIQPTKKNQVANPEPEEAAIQLVREAKAAIVNADYNTAMARIREVKTNYPKTRAAQSTAQLEAQLLLIGKSAGPLTVEKWYGPRQARFEDAPVTLVVFWEAWCPHCQKEVPKLQKTYDTYRARGLNVVGLTQINKPEESPEAAAVALIKKSRITYPMAKDDGSMAQRFGVQGIPTLAAVKNGKIVWHGHPGKLSDAVIESWL